MTAPQRGLPHYPASFPTPRSAGRVGCGGTGRPPVASRTFLASFLLDKAINHRTSEPRKHQTFSDSLGVLRGSGRGGCGQTQHPQFYLFFFIDVSFEMPHEKNLSILKKFTNPDSG